ncbi:ATP-binding protein [Alkalicella caledoniensis]|uniref:ATP-binding protein n=1 Tax=Alkalicella caledoniensis TaxID=2731377 RepID=UPI00248441A8|nr:ATP-binding protein [Alkalicella caledoniensis]
MASSFSTGIPPAIWYDLSSAARPDPHSPTEWTTLFENETMVAALVDRLTFRSHVLNMNGPSYRSENSEQDMD